MASFDAETGAPSKLGEGMDGIRQKSDHSHLVAGRGLSEIEFDDENGTLEKVKLLP